MVPFLSKRKYCTDRYRAGKLEGCRVHTMRPSFSGVECSVCLCICVVVYNDLNLSSLVYSSQGFFSIKFFFLFKIVTYQSIFAVIDCLYFIPKCLSTTNFRASMFAIPPNVNISSLTSLQQSVDCSVHKEIVFSACSIQQLKILVWKCNAVEFYPVLYIYKKSQS